MTKHKKMLLFLLIQSGVITLCQGLQAVSVVESLVQQMRENGVLCKNNSLEAMIDVRWNFLNANADVTMDELVAALKHVGPDGKDIVDFLKSLNAGVSKEYAAIIENDRKNGVWVVTFGYGDKSVQDFIDKEYLKRN